MIINKILTIIALLRFFLKRYFFKNSGVINYVYSKVNFHGYRRIFIGNSNIFNEYSTIHVNNYSNNQHIYLGNKNNISRFAIIISQGGYIRIGDDNFIGERVQIQGRGGVEIGNRCMIAANTFISSSNHDIHDPTSDNYLRKEMPKKTKIDDFVWIGANCVIMAGVHIGHHAIVGAGSIVTKSIEPYSMVAGNPARIIKKYDYQNKEWKKT